jgi:hypothetical protein
MRDKLRSLTRPPTGREALAIYLNDHLAGSTGGLELAKRAAHEHAGSELGSFLSGLARDIEEDRETLRRLMAAVGAPPQQYKVALAWVAEKAGRLKLNGSVVKPSPLSPIVELESLALGIHGKLAMWTALQASLGDDGPGGVRFDALAARAERQETAVDTQRRKLAGELLTL